MQNQLERLSLDGINPIMTP